jgi:hypothetical protein
MSNLHTTLSSVEYKFDSIQSSKTRSHLHRAIKVLSSGQCKHIYFDFGSNLGVQIRKLYEPQLYPGAPILPIFDARFGTAITSNRSNVCAFGFEPNPHLTDTLEQIEASYNKQGWPVVMFTETAVSTHGRNVSYFLEPTAKPDNHEWGASLTAWHKSMTEIIAGSIPIALFVHYAAKKREGTGSQIIATMDVEGAEYELVPHLMVTGALCLFNEIFIDFNEFSVTGDHPSNNFVADIKCLLKNSKECNSTIISELNDESYGITQMDLPGGIPWH